MPNACGVCFIRPVKLVYADICPGALDLGTILMVCVTNAISAAAHLAGSIMAFQGVKAEISVKRVS